MSVYNGQRYLGAAIDSILAQTFQEFEFIIVDDGSTDNTESLIRAYSDSRIRLISKPNTGLADSLNVGLEAAKGTWIARIDADDISEPQRLERQLQRIRASPELVLLVPAVQTSTSMAA
ncbi:MAG: glycosyltransferase family 2 protein [Chloroflexi bacterium]|nr:glycosyltransferase family 2 protein [Chloroflexota bacterium]